MTDWLEEQAIAFEGAGQEEAARIAIRAACEMLALETREAPAASG